MINTLFLSTFVGVIICHRHIHALSIIVDDITVTSSTTGNEISMILLTKEPFTCSTTVDFNGTLDDSLTNTTTLYYDLLINGIVSDEGSIMISDDTDLSLPLSIETNEVSVDKTGNTKLLMIIWIDDDMNDNDDDMIASGDTETELFSITGFTTMVPLIFIIIFAIFIKNVYVSLYLGIWIGSFIISGCSFRYGFEMSVGVYILESAADVDHQYVILFTVFLSGLVFLIQRSGGTDGFSTLISSKLAKTGKMTQFSCFLSGLLLFFDDYANALVVGTTFQSLTDQFFISREKLAFLVDATSAPVASIVPLSSWIGFELQQIQEQLDLIKENNGGVMPDGLTDNAFVFFISTISTRFYPIYMLVFQVVVITLSIEFGSMLIAERLVRVDQRKDGGKGSTKNEGDELDSGVEPEEDTPRKWWNMVIPILTLIILILAVMINTGIEGVEAEGVSKSARNVFANSDPWGGLLYGTFGTSIFTIFLFLVQFKYKGSIVPPSLMSCKHYFFHKKDENEEDDEDAEQKDEDVAVPLIGFSESIEVWIKGIAFMSPAVCILILVWAIGALMTDIGADRYFTRIISEDVSAESLPTLVFILAALLSAATGTSWGTMTILFPLVSPAAWTICEPLENGVFLYTVTMSQILSGSIFGDHSSPLSDTTLLSSVASGCNLFNHVWTQMPYAIWVAFFGIICGTVMVGKGIAPGVCIFVGILVQTLCTWFVAAPVIPKNGRFDVFTELRLIFMNKCTKRKEKEEHDLITLKAKTIAFVANGGKEDNDFFIAFLNLIHLDRLFAKCGVDINKEYGAAGTKESVDVYMTQVPASSAPEIDRDVTNNDGIEEEEDDMIEHKEGGNDKDGTEHVTAEYGTFAD